WSSDVCSSDLGGSRCRGTCTGGGSRTCGCRTGTDAADSGASTLGLLLNGFLSCSRLRILLHLGRLVCLGRCSIGRLSVSGLPFSRSRSGGRACGRFGSACWSKAFRRPGVSPGGAGKAAAQRHIG